MVEVKIGELYHTIIYILLKTHISLNTVIELLNDDFSPPGLQYWGQNVGSCMCTFRRLYQQ